MTNRSAPLTEKQYVLPLILVTSLFFLWAFGVNLNDILIPHLKKTFQLTDTQSSLIQSHFLEAIFWPPFRRAVSWKRLATKKEC